MAKISCHPGGTRTFLFLIIASSCIFTSFIISLAFSISWSILGVLKDKTEVNVGDKCLDQLDGLGENNKFLISSIIGFIII